MAEVTELSALLAEKQRELLEFERVTTVMLACRAEELEELVEQRGQTIGAIDAIDARIEACCVELPEGDAARTAVHNTGAADTLPAELLPVYDAARGLRAITSRLQETDFQAAMRLRVEQEKILGQIKDANRGVGAQASRYFGPAFGGGQNGMSDLGHA